ncbi:histidine acid phosphatase family protein [Xylariaceae sp. FL0016]|nr:histidine acid phosphatase family protein [Xylariaceae sp. FL0016]
MWNSWHWASSLALWFTSTAVPVTTQNVDLSWHPPRNTSVNNLTAALHGDGVCGFVFNSSQTPDARYGVYNWCNMPHVRTSEYVRPPAEYTLRYVEVIQRHHKRTPYASNAFPVESYQWNCNGQGLYYYGQVFSDDKQAARGYWDQYISSLNPFTPTGWVGTCQFPQITSGGLSDSWVHGSDIFEVYHDLLGFLPSRQADWRSKVVYRVTQNVITSQVAGMLIHGMWSTTDSIPLMIQAAGVDSLEPQYPCPTGDDLLDTVKSSANRAWKAHLDDAEGLFATLDDISGVPSDDAGFHASFDHYYDNLSARQCHAKPLPCKLVDGVNTTTCVSQAVADAVYRMGQWEYSQVYRDAGASLAASVASYGVWIAELSAHLRRAVAGTSGPIYFHNVAHDGSVSRVLSILQIDSMVWPGMGSEVIFELYEKSQNGTNSSSTETTKSRMTRSWKEGNHFVRVLFGGQVLRSSNPSLGLMEMVPAETLLAYFDGLVGVNASLVVGKCQSTIS